MLYTIVVGPQAMEHPYWEVGSFVALGDNDWGPSPTLNMVHVPTMFLTRRSAQMVIDDYGTQFGVGFFEVHTFARQP